VVKLNHHFPKLVKEFLFLEVEKRTETFLKKNKGKTLLNLGIGDVTHPLSPSIAKALSEASLEMGDKNTFRGYGPEEGYLFLREKIAEYDYKNCHITPDEIFISDGAKNDMANLQEIFSKENRVAIPDPTYPVYLDTNVMAGRTRPSLKKGSYGGITYLPCVEENGFNPEPPTSHVDLIYLCTPNNPTGVAMNRDLLKRWIDYAKKEKAIILIDAAYEAFITDPAVPKTIYEIEGAHEVAIEVRSFSKTAGFTGLRCSYTVVPKALKIFDFGSFQSLHSFWKQRHHAKFGGVAYPIQRAAAAIYTEEGQKEVKERISLYTEQAKFLLKGLLSLGVKAYGGVDSPYIWCKTPKKISSWDFFDTLLHEKQIIAVPGSGFGSAGEGFIRLSAFANQATLKEALSRLGAQ
jgi:LL-diaminopimelate aminotransferase